MPATVPNHFPIQSISIKLFSLMLAISRCGDEIWTLLGKEPSDTVFYSLAVA
jgi:glutaminase